MAQTQTNTGLPQHVEDTVLAVEQLHTQHYESSTRPERLLDRLKGGISRPVFFALFVIVLIFWVVENLYGPKDLRVDPSPFAFLGLALGAAAVLLTILILETQRRADRLAAHREKLILQLAFVSERKTAKLIALVEELRRDLPHVPNRDDPEAQQMVKSVDAAAVTEALKETEAPVAAKTNATDR